VVDAASLDHVHQVIAWIPMLDSDERPAAVEASAMFRASRVPQLWDGARRLGVEVGRSVGAPGWTAWDIYLFYEPGAEWTEAGLPRPAAWLAQAGGRVVAGIGTLPARGDQAALLEPLKGSAVVAGDRGDLPRLLTEVAGRFAAVQETRTVIPSLPAR
jgi:hypothetical protein